MTDPAVGLMGMLLIIGLGLILAGSIWPSTTEQWARVVPFWCSRIFWSQGVIAWSVALAVMFGSLYHRESAPTKPCSSAAIQSIDPATGIVACVRVPVDYSSRQPVHCPAPMHPEFYDSAWFCVNPVWIGPPPPSTFSYETP